MREQLLKWLGKQTQPLPSMEIPLKDPEKEKARAFFDSEIEIKLVSREVVSSEKLKIDRCSNEIYILELKDDGKALFKPMEGATDDMRDKIKKETYHKRERAAYLVDRFLGFGLVPPTVIREQGSWIGSAHDFIDDHRVGFELEKSEKLDLKDDFIKMWLFDYIIWNSDRNVGNWLVKNKKLYAIDHGLSFAPTDILRFYHNFFDESIPQEIKQKILDFSSWEQGREVLRTMLKEQLTSEEADACLARIDVLANWLKDHDEIPGNIPGLLNFTSDYRNKDPRKMVVQEADSSDW